MFFMMGITSGRKELDFHQMIVCKECGSYGRYQVFMTYMVLSIFFIPVFKWNRQYFVQTSCCNTIYELDPEVGKAIEHGEDIEITADDLSKVQTGPGVVKICSKCGYRTSEDFEYCPKCGIKF